MQAASTLGGAGAPRTAPAHAVAILSALAIGLAAGYAVGTQSPTSQPASAAGVSGAAAVPETGVAHPPAALQAAGSQLIDTARATPATRGGARS